MWRVAPDELAFLRAENVRLAAENLYLASRVGRLEDKVASRDEDLRFHSKWIEKLRRLLEKNTERYRTKIRELQKGCAPSTPDTQRIEQLESGIVALQEANHFKEMQILRLRQEVGAAKASVSVLRQEAEATSASVNRMKEHLTCSISQDLMQVPCLLSTGQLYNRDSVLEWLWRSRSNRCPNTQSQIRLHDNSPPVCIALNEVCAILARM